MQLVDSGRVMEDRVRKIVTFLSSLKDSSAILSLIHQKIYERYPGQLPSEAPTPSRGMVYGSFTVSCPSSPHLHTVSRLGLMLLALTGREGAWHSVHKVMINRISSSLLLALGFLAALMVDQIVDMVVGNIICTTEEEGEHLCFREAQSKRCWTSVFCQTFRS